MQGKICRSAGHGTFSLTWPLLKKCSDQGTCISSPAYLSASRAGSGCFGAFRGVSAFRGARVAGPFAAPGFPMSRRWEREQTPMKQKNPGFPGFLFGAPGGIRTPNLLIRSQMLYPLSYGRVAETTGFEPAALRKEGNSLAGSPIRPLWHVSRPRTSVMHHQPPTK